MPTTHLPVTYEEERDQLTIKFNGRILPERVRVIIDDSTCIIIGYMTTNGKYFEKAAAAVTEQISFSLNHTPLDNFIIVWRTNKDSPFFSTTGINSQDRVKYLHNPKEQPDGSKMVFIKFDYRDHADRVINHTDVTVLVIDKSCDRVILVPAGAEAVIPERFK